MVSPSGLLRREAVTLRELAERARRWGAHRTSLTHTGSAPPRRSETFPAPGTVRRVTRDPPPASG